MDWSEVWFWVLLVNRLRERGTRGTKWRAVIPAAWEGGGRTDSVVLNCLWLGKWGGAPNTLQAAGNLKPAFQSFVQ